MPQCTVYILHILVVSYIFMGADILILVHGLCPALCCDNVTLQDTGYALFAQSGVLGDLLHIRLPSELLCECLNRLAYCLLVCTQALRHVHYILTLCANPIKSAKRIEHMGLDRSSLFRVV